MKKFYFFPFTDEQVTTITKLGKTMANFPINPRYSKIICLATQQTNTNIKNIISYIVCLISGLSVPELFIDGDTTITKEINNTNGNEKQIEQIKIKYSQLRQSWLDSIPDSHTHLLGDLMLLLVALGAVEYEQHTRVTTGSNNLNTNDKCLKFCEQYGIRYKAIIEARKLRKQLINTGKVKLLKLRVELRFKFSLFF
jgi:ATP-dependent RNA helicase DHX37/DHR1